MKRDRAHHVCLFVFADRRSRTRASRQHLHLAIIRSGNPCIEQAFRTQISGNAACTVASTNTDAQRTVVR